MPESERKEPGKADVQHRERGDPRQQQNPIDKQKGHPQEGSQDRPPAGKRRDGESPWMGGG